MGFRSNNSPERKPRLDPWDIHCRPGKEYLVRSLDKARELCFPGAAYWKNHHSNPSVSFKKVSNLFIIIGFTIFIVGGVQLLYNAKRCRRILYPGRWPAKPDFNLFRFMLSLFSSLILSGARISFRNSWKFLVLVIVVLDLCVGCLVRRTMGNNKAGHCPMRYHSFFSIYSCKKSRRYKNMWNYWP